MNVHLASASGNVFAYLWADEVPATFDGPSWARALCPRGIALGLDGIFLLQRPGLGPWRMEHWDLDGAHTFCSNGTRAALGVPGAPEGAQVEVLSNDQALQLQRRPEGVGLRLPEGEGFGLKALPAVGLEAATAAFGFVGNPQLVVRVPSVAAVDLAAFAPPLRHHAAIPGGTNVNVVEVLGPGHARIRSWERGVEGETLCCGTGCSVAAAWLAATEGGFTWTLENASGDPVTVSLAWAAPGSWTDLWLTGPVRALGTLHLGPTFAGL
ncbi:MAG TPA: hypothetical protein VJ570_08220 [Holophagaceae bacterium]|nr:hypothetical protein [Holophagaceae bacterium]